MELQLLAQRFTLTVVWKIDHRYIAILVFEIHGKNNLCIIIMLNKYLLAKNDGVIDKRIPDDGAHRVC